MVAVVLGNAVGLAANAAAAVCLQKAAELLSAASEFILAGNTKDAVEYFLSSGQEIRLAASISSVQAFSEVTVLLLIVAAFLVAGFFCARRIAFISSRLLGAASDSAAAAAGRTLRLRTIGTTAFVFAAFLLRSVFSTMFAVATQLQDIGNSCAQHCLITCSNVFTLVARWMFFTPEFQLTIVLISSPLALIVALWGMTDKRSRQLMQSTRTMPSQRSLASLSPQSNS